MTTITAPRCPPLPARLVELRNRVRSQVAELLLAERVAHEAACQLAWRGVVLAAGRLLPTELLPLIPEFVPDEFDPAGVCILRFTFEDCWPLAVRLYEVQGEWDILPWESCAGAGGTVYDPLGKGEPLVYLVEPPAALWLCPDLGAALDIAEIGRDADVGEASDRNGVPY